MFKLSISLVGEDLTLRVFSDAVSTFLDLLHEVDRTVSHRPEVTWRVAELRYDSPATVSVIGIPKTKAVDPTPIIGRAILAGFERLETGEGRPIHFSDEALDAAKRLGGLRGRGGVRRISLAGGDPLHPDAERKALEITQRVAAAVDDLIGEKFESIGSVEGRLETISAHGTLSLTVYESLTGRAVKCDLAQNLKPQALAAFEKRVLVRGTVIRDSSGRARRIRAERLEVFPDEKSMPESVIGIDKDFTEGMDTAEFLDKRWR